MLLVGIGHRSGHGKDTLANMLIDNLRIANTQLSYGKMSMAWRGKILAYELYGWAGLREPDFYETPQGRELRNVKLPLIDLTPVEVWIKLLSHAIRDNVYDRTWTNWLICSETITQYDICIVPDMRFIVELPIFDYTIRCHDSRVARREGLSVDDVLADWEGWDDYVANNGTRKELNHQAIHIADKLLHRYRNTSACTEERSAICRRIYRGIDTDIPPIIYSTNEGLRSGSTL